MSTPTTYWVAIPGSTKPSLLDLNIIVARVSAGSIPNDASVCKVGDADWVPVESILPKPVAEVVTDTADAPAKILTDARDAAILALRAERAKAAALNKGDIWAVQPSATSGDPLKRYANLLDVSGSLRAYGALLKVLGWVVASLGLLGGFVAADKLGGAGALIVVLFTFVTGVILHVAGTFIAAMGESLLALADIATNTGKMAGASS